MEFVPIFDLGQTTCHPDVESAADGDGVAARQLLEKLMGRRHCQEDNCSTRFLSVGISVVQT